MPIEKKKDEKRNLCSWSVPALQCWYIRKVHVSSLRLDIIGRCFSDISLYQTLYDQDTKSRRALLSTARSHRRERISNLQEENRKTSFCSREEKREGGRKSSFGRIVARSMLTPSMNTYHLIRKLTFPN